MKVSIVTRFALQWLKGFKKVFDNPVIVDTADKLKETEKECVLFMWCDKDAVEYVANKSKSSKVVVFIRRYEYYTLAIETMDWTKVAAVIMVNDFLAVGFKERTGVTPHVIYNGVTPEDWKFSEHSHGRSIAMVGYINQKKNIPLALQILNELPRDYALHLAGAVQDGATMDYIGTITRRMRIKVVIHGQVGDIDAWLDNKDYILSTAISEGCPNNIIEAMAKGIKPIVHNWPGADKIFPEEYLFNTIYGAADRMKGADSYSSREYREFIEKAHGAFCYKKVHEVVKKLYE